MCRLTPEIMAQAIRTVDRMDLREKERLADEIYAEQPNLLASVLVHSQLGSTMDRIDRVLRVLLVSVQATKIAGLKLRLVTEDDQDQGLRRYAGHIKFVEGLDARSQTAAINQFVQDHPEKYLLAYAIEQLQKAGITRLDHENDRNLVLATLNIATCISLAVLKPGQHV